MKSKLGLAVLEPPLGRLELVSYVGYRCAFFDNPQSYDRHLDRGKPGERRTARDESVI
jgi:hypothetical protein